MVCLQTYPRYSYRDVYKQTSAINNHFIFIVCLNWTERKLCIQIRNNFENNDFMPSSYKVMGSWHNKHKLDQHPVA